ncbi:MAG: signal peptidase I [Bacilli bacterium]
MKEKVKAISPYIIVVLIVILIRTFIITPAIVDGSSMEPTLNDNNIVILNKVNYKVNDINRFDVVILNYKDQKLIKRVIGLPGEHIEYKSNNLYVDGFLTLEAFNNDDTANFKLESLGFLTIPGDKYFVVGDNRNNSKDSRFIGLIDKQDILGKATFRLFPITKVGRIK